ncbi:MULTISPECIES: hypothetical protein [Brucella]|uniref:hypothetical protein n=1 Tax=Brucella intermedia TaxID=94625 RepID=UPI00124D0B27|nr:hypothetical protein [Brucella intermedia]KAB2722445.1 hypothetical protein F9K73_00140 [Brucella intermedia]
MTIESACLPPTPQQVCVAIYEHRHGADIRVFTDAERAMRWRTALAKDWWRNAFDEPPPPDDVIGEEYFERMLERDEFFSMQTCEIEGGLPASNEPTPPRDL